MVKEAHQGKTLPEILDSYGAAKARFHFFLCAGPDCCSPEEGEKTWKALKAKVKTLYPNLKDTSVYRTKVDCLRVCQQGATAVCYPLGAWYHGLDESNVGEVLDHILSGNPEPHPLEFYRHPLPPPGEV